MSFILSSISSALSHYSPVAQQPFQSSIAGLSTRDREALVHDVAVELNQEDVEESLSAVEETLAGCRASLEAFERKERFVGVRLGRYRTLMEGRKETIRHLAKRVQPSSSPSPGDNAPNEDDVESKNVENMREELDALQIKHAADRNRLRDVEEMHKDIIAQTETFRRRIHELEEKQQDLMTKRDECQDFLLAAAECT